MGKEKLAPETAAAAVLAVVLLFVLFIRPIIGVADNGDFSRIMASAGLEYITQDPEERYFGFVTREYRVKTVFFLGSNAYPSTQTLLVKAAIGLSRLAGQDGVFDIRFLALLYSVVFIAALYLAVRCKKDRKPFAAWLLALLLIVVFADIGYISYFNSLYGEPVSFCFALLMAAIAAYLFRGSAPRLGALLAFFAAALMLSGAKAQNVPVGVLIALFGFRLIRLRTDWKWRTVCVAFSVVLASMAVFIYLSVPKEIKDCNRYHTVFFGILKDSPAIAEDLEELGLDEKYAVLAGTHYFMKEYPVDIRAPRMEEELYGRINYAKILWFYLKHPARYLQKLDKAAQNAFLLQHGYGNFEKLQGIEYGSTAGAFAFWSNLKKTVLPNSLAFVMLFHMAWFAILLTKRRMEKNPVRRLYYEFLILIGLAGLSQIFTTVIGDGEADLGRHLFLFNVCFDLMFVLGAAWLAEMILQLGGRIRKIGPFLLKKWMVIKIKIKGTT